MPDSVLRDLVIQRLDADTTPEDTWSPLVLAALDGETELAQLLDTPSERPSTKPGVAGQGEAAPTQPRVAFLKSIAVEGFRGIGPKTTLELTPGPGLTLVVGRNGSGKSSFAEALELLLTGDTYRWAQRTKVWRDGWRNLHHPKAAITGELALEGEKGTCTVACEWAPDAELEAATGWAQVHGKPRGTKDSLGWNAPLAAYRPFLSYNELGSMLDDGPSKLYDALSKVLGLDDLVHAQEAVQQARTSREKAHKDADQERKTILARLETLTDERAARVKAALEKKDWGLAEVEPILAGDAPAGEKDGALEILKRLALLPSPGLEAMAAAITTLREAAQRQRTTAQTVAGKSDDLATLLDHAIRFHKAHGDGDCPVCGRSGALDAEWHEAKAREAETLHQVARDASEARQATKLAIGTARKLSSLDRDLLKKPASVKTDALTAGVLGLLDQAFPQTSDDSPEAAETLANAMEQTATDLVGQLDALKQTAAKEVEARQDAWRPHATAIGDWLTRARKAKAAAESVSNLKAAEKWIKEAAETIRNERFAPIAEQTRAIWDQLKLQSNVSLEKVHLGGSGKARKVELKVSVDGQEGAALGVMSQGELHSLALSLFVPRATLAESPFRFIVIDDPVQSMDPARVDGLAHVLHTASKARQVVVFTHDDRLPEAVRRLGIPATQIEVTRRECSVVEVRRSKDPVSRYIEDAMALAYTDDLPKEVSARVIPGLCREALEAACMEAVRRRRIGRGEAHSEVEALLAGVSGARALAALALFDDDKRASDVMGRLHRENRLWADTFRLVNEGTHEETNFPPVDLTRSAEKLAGWLQALA